MPSLVERLRLLPARLWQWLVVEPVPFWLAIGVPLAATIAAAIARPGSELATRVAGFALTLAGVGLVVKGIRDKRRLFERPSAIARFRQWLSRLPGVLAGPQRHIGIGATGVEVAVLSGQAHVWFSAPPGATLERRIEIAEDNLRRVDARLSEVQAGLRNELAALRELLTTETATRTTELQQIKVRIEDLSVGGLDFEAAGVVWVVAGSALATFPGEIAAALAKLL